MPLRKVQTRHITQATNEIDWNSNALHIFVNIKRKRRQIQFYQVTFANVLLGPQKYPINYDKFCLFRCVAWMAWRSQAAVPQLFVTVTSTTLESATM